MIPPFRERGHVRPRLRALCQPAASWIELTQTIPPRRLNVRQQELPQATVALTRVLIYIRRNAQVEVSVSYGSALHVEEVILPKACELTVSSRCVPRSHDY